MEPKANGDPEPQQEHPKLPKRRREDVTRESRDVISSAKRRFCPESVSSKVTDWIEQLSKEIPELAPPIQDYVNPEMASLAQDAAVVGFQRSQSPLYRVISQSGSSFDPPLTTISSRNRRLVEREDYRKNNLEANGIYINFEIEGPALPKPVFDTCKSIRRALSSSRPLSKQMQEDLKSLIHMQKNRPSPTEAEIEKWFQSCVFPTVPNTDAMGLKAQSSISFTRGCVPGAQQETHSVSVPKPDLVYGYTLVGRVVHFSDAQQIAGRTMSPKMGMDGSDLAFPFLIIEYISDQGIRWAAENQCMGGSATSVAMVNGLNDMLKKCNETQRVNNTAFSFVINHFHAMLYVSWMGEGEKEYLVRRLLMFDLYAGNEFSKFTTCVKIIINWGKGDRLKEIKWALDVIGGKDRILTSTKAKTLDRSPDTQSSKRQRSIT
ncbi:hypothetical protein PG993_004173 [Apiospora rasikravindrae]|uniref:DUF7924 domain-containing protein n=1 Tax=Apiospora rasikravindrae TaxID=990691 RepID=A0ABR1TEE1_9PEZI